jgi:hypothetical protein
MTTIEIRIKEHKTTGLLMGLCDEIPGFVVHAHSEEEMLDKLGAAFESYMRAVGRPVEGVHVKRHDAPAGYWPPKYTADFAEAA